MCNAAPLFKKYRLIVQKTEKKIRTMQSVVFTFT